METVKTLDPAWTVNETVARYPTTAAVFNRFGVDTCCGGGVPITAAAAREGIDPDALLAAVREAVERS
jgi:regulator of cell morphogenesis and NO signaling